MNNVVIFVLSCIAYIVAGQIGGLLSIPPGFASAVWPASGVALALALKYRSLASPLGSALGSFAINLAIASDNFSNLSSGQFAIALCVGSAAFVQTSVGYWLFRRCIGEFLELTAPNQIVRFVFLVAILGCTVSCSLSTLTLWLAGAIPTNLVGFTWLTWWVGDSLGVLFFAPFLLTIFETDSAISRLQKIQITVPTVIIFLCTWIMFSTSQERQNSENLMRIKTQATDFFEQISDGIHASEQVLTAYDAFINSTPEFDQNSFDRFSAVMLENEKVLYGVGWTIQVPSAQRNQVEQTMRDAGWENFHFKQISATGDLIAAEKQDYYYPVLYIYPLLRNQAVLGLNLGASPARKAALVAARELRRPVATAPIILAQRHDDEKATILYRPIFNQSQGEFVGYVSGVIQFSQILDTIVTSLNNAGFSLALSDVSDSAVPVDFIRQDLPSLQGYPTFLFHAKFGERDYSIGISANINHPVPGKDWISWMVLTGGFLIAAFAQVFILAITGSHAHVREEVERKTRDLKIQTELAQEASRAKSEFLSNMSHELRTPLNAIIGLINMCLKTELNSKQADYLNKVSLASATLLSLINQTLDHAKIEAGRMEVAYEPFSIEYLLRKLRAVFELTAEEKGIEFTTRVKGKVPDSVVGDELRLEQILLNLLGNAFKFTTVGKVTLTLEYSADKLFIFSVEDTGCGIPQHFQGKLFSAFSQVDSSTSRVFGGTGLGLSISSSLASLMGGKLLLVGSSEQGSCFSVQLPLSVAEGSSVFGATNEETTASSPSRLSDKGGYLPSVKLVHEQAVPNRTAMAEKSAHKRRGPLSGRVVLLVEDIEINQMVAAGILEDSGAEVIIANNGEESITKVDQHPEIDIVLMDVQMPVMDGFEATRRIRSTKKHDNLPILAMTANAMDQDVALCLEVGMNGHISKPIDAQLLVEKIQSNLQTQLVIKHS